ncbi:Helitron helicase-like protein [Phytophthora palmivora]|uniref:Helitron helicase-like protein n=1 Tax=Phytophthora palmivora TaxID=4796 RepID=A0A2P4XAG8_9STRA|nr:Helitron helicase-like protein [Phytophthora palmivora]
MYQDVNKPDVTTDDYFANRTILTTTNAVVHRINAAVAERSPGETREYLTSHDEYQWYPPDKLLLKTGILIMMARNLNPDLGLCNRTHLRTVDLKDHIIHATIMTEERKGQHATYYFLPVQPAFVMTINKAQGQTVQYLGLYLATPCFSHGQPYVALSRVCEKTRFNALIENPELEEDDGVHTDNVVYRQIFD